ncbi:cri-2, partial [Pristionchus pacificus]
FQTMNSLTLFTLLALATISLACKCKEQTAKESFCQAHWVSHLKIKLRVSKQPVPGDETRKGLNNIRYAVEHLEVFKKPSNLTALPNEIFTPSEPPACGLILDVGKEYLLAGRVAPGGTLSTVICGQVRPDDTREELFENVLEWKKVPTSFPPKMKEMQC